MRDYASILPLQLETVSYRADDCLLLDRISARFRAGPRSLILGPNGAGKSLLLRVCHGLVKPTGGTLSWAVARPHAQAMVFQNPVLLRRSVRANITYALALAGMGWRARRDRAEQVLEEAGLAARARHPAAVLSAGEKQKLVLARAWALRPEVLFLDEPTANLDPGATKVIEQTITAMHGAGVKIIMTTHDLGQARRLADEIFFLHRGKLCESGKAETFFTQPRTAEAAAFLRGELVI